MNILIKLYLIFKINIKYLLKLIVIKLNFKYENFEIMEGNKNILFNTSYHWTFSWFEYGLMKKLSRGNNVTALICDGMEYCEHETITTPKPNCTLCSKVTIHLCKSAGAQIIKYSDILSKTKNTKTNDKIFLNNLKHYSKGNIRAIPDKMKKKISVAASKCKGVAVSVFKNHDFEFSVTANGKFIQTGYFYETSLSKKVKIISYESYQSPRKMIVGINSCSVDQFVNKKEMNSKNLPNNRYLKNYSNEFKKNWGLGIITPFVYHDQNAFINKKEIIKKLKLSSKKHKILLIPNVTWDSSCLSMNGAFEDIEDWLKSTIKFLMNKDVEIIVRAHPAETKVPFHVKSRYGVVRFLEDEFGKLRNLILVDSHEDLDTISLAKCCNKVVVYSGTLGIELPMYNIRPICPIKNYYTGYGFTLDTFSKDKYFQSLSPHFQLSCQDESSLKNLYKLIYLYKEKGSFDMLEDKRWPIKNSNDLQSFSENKIFDNIIEFSNYEKSRFEF